jgi:hypothetical protein
MVPIHDVEEVRFSRGKLSGLAVKAPPTLAANLPDIKLFWTASGRLYDQDAQTYVRDVEIVRPPTPAGRQS